MNNLAEVLHSALGLCVVIGVHMVIHEALSLKST